MGALAQTWLRRLRVTTTAHTTDGTWQSSGTDNPTLLSVEIVISRMTNVGFTCAFMVSSGQQHVFEAELCLFVAGAWLEYGFSFSRHEAEGSEVLEFWEAVNWDQVSFRVHLVGYKLAYSLKHSAAAGEVCKAK